MKRIFRTLVALSLVVLLTGGSVLSAASAKPKLYVAPPTESTINGIPESQVCEPMGIMGPPIFVDYAQSSGYYTPWFRLIARTSFDNRNGTSAVPLTLNITHSTQQGSEWYISLSITAEFKTSFRAKLGATVGGGYKETRSTNEAVGCSTTIQVPAGTHRGVEAFWGGQNTNGTVYYKRVDTGSLTGYTPVFAVPMGAFVHTQHVDVNFRTYTP